MSMALLSFGAALLVAWVATGGVRRYALKQSILDHPNDRSSHAVPTPRGGGLAIALVCLPGVALLARGGVLSPSVAVALLGGGTLVAWIGWLDDRRGVSAGVRGGVHVVAAVWAVAWIGGLPVLRLGGAEAPLGWAGAALACVAVVWLTNLYNFMDGIDGIAGGEALVAGVAGAGFLLVRGHAGLAAAALLAAGASAGFLAWNWAPAKIFMGDVGSGLLGFFFGTLAVASERTGAVPLLVWVVLLGAFVFDATATLLRRLARGERWYLPHRSHAYQRAVQAGWSHAQVSGAVFVLNLMLAALAAWMLQDLDRLPLGLVAALGLVAVAYLGVERVHPMVRAPS